MLVPVVVVVWALLVNVESGAVRAGNQGTILTVKGALVPAATIPGSDKPLITKRELLELAPVTVTFAPVAVRKYGSCPAGSHNHASNRYGRRGHTQLSSR